MLVILGVLALGVDSIRITALLRLVDPLSKRTVTGDVTVRSCAVDTLGGRSVGAATLTIHNSGTKPAAYQATVEFRSPDGYRYGDRLLLLPGALVPGATVTQPIVLAPAVPGGAEIVCELTEATRSEYRS